MIRRRGLALPGALALMAASGTWMVATAPPAAAYVCRFGVETPPLLPEAIFASPDVRFTGPFEATPGPDDRAVEVTFTQSPGALPPPTVRSGDIGPAGRYDVTVGGLALNGRYTAQVKAIHAGPAPVMNCDGGLAPERRDTEAVVARSFKVSVRANPPRNVAARFDPSTRRATVTWEPSGDPDINGYRITRTVGAAKATWVDVRPAPLTWTDTNLPAGRSTITYAVTTSRNGPDPGTSSDPSVAVAAAPLTVPAAPATPVPTTGGGGGRPLPGGTSTTVPFVLGRAVPGGGAPSGTDTPGGGLRFSDATPGADGQAGFRPLVPYPPPGQPGEPSLSIEGGEEAIGSPTSRGGGEGETGPPGLAFVASGLLSSVVAAHVLWLRRQALRPERAGPGIHDRSPLEAVASDDPVPPPPAPPPAESSASPFAPVAVRHEDGEGDAGVGGSEDPVVAQPRRRPLRALREPVVGLAAAGAAAGAGTILRPARDGSGTFEPVTPRPRSLRPPRRVPPVAGAEGLAPAATDRPDDDPGNEGPPTGGAGRVAEAAPAARPAAEPSGAADSVAGSPPASTGLDGASPSTPGALARDEEPASRRPRARGRVAVTGRPGAASRVRRRSTLGGVPPEAAASPAPEASDEAPPRSARPSSTLAPPSPAVEPVAGPSPAGRGRAIVLLAKPRHEAGAAAGGGPSTPRPAGGNQAPAPSPARDEEPQGDGAPSGRPAASGGGEQPADVLAAASASASAPEGPIDAGSPAPPAADHAVAPAVAAPLADRATVPARVRLRPRIGRNRKAATPWVEAEPVEPPPDAQPGGDELSPPADAAEATGSTEPAGAPPGPGTGSAPAPAQGAGPLVLILRPKVTRPS